MESTKPGQVIRGGLRGFEAVILATLLAACGGGSHHGSGSASGSGNAPASYTISVSVSGLSGSGLILELNLANDLAVAADGTFTFTTTLAAGTSYMVSVKTQPSSPPQGCLAANASGVVSNTNVTGIAINCSLSNCPTLPSNSPVPSTPTMYVLDTGTTLDGKLENACVIGYPANSSGAVSPTISITLPAPAAAYKGLTTDSFGNIYVRSNAGPQAMEGAVLVFAPGANGMATPVRTLVVPGTDTVLPNTIAVDGTGAIYVATQDSILVFAPGADGNAAPIRTIGVNTAMGCGELAVDANGNIVCMFTEFGLIEVFTNAVTGNGTLARTISIATSGAAGGEIIGLSLDPAGNIYVAATVELNSGLPVSIVGFAGGTGGAGTPINTLSADALPNSVNVRHLGFDADGNLYVYELGTADSNREPIVLRFTATANGFAAPTSETLVSFPIYIDGGMGFAIH
jgi:serine/threonine-protein kinase